MGFSRSGVRNELDGFLKKASQNNSTIGSYSQSAFSQYRKKLQSAALVFLLQKLIAFFYRNGKVKLYKNQYRIIPIDSSVLNLPKDPVLTERYGMSTNQTDTCSTTARISIAYDAINKVVLDAQISHTDIGEQEMARNALKHLNPKTDILVFDRGYPGISFLMLLMEKGFKFCFRISTSWKTALEQLENKNDTAWALPRGKRFYINQKSAYLKEPINGLRLVKIELPNESELIMLTNLQEEDGFTLKDLNYIYKLRWSVEEFYKRLKNVTHLEYFSGKTPISIEQDFYCRTIMLNLSAMIETQEVQPKLEKKKEAKHKQKANTTQITLKLKAFFYDIFYGDNLKQTLEKMGDLLNNCYDIIRNNRSFKRKTGFKQRSKPLNYKA